MAMIVNISKLLAALSITIKMVFSLSYPQSLQRPDLHRTKAETNLLLWFPLSCLIVLSFSPALPSLFPKQDLQHFGP